MTTPERPTAANAGCWLEGSRGWTITPAAIDIAVNYGFVLDEEAQAAMDAYHADDGAGMAEIMNDLCDEAVDYLNDNIAPLGFTFGFHDGEFFLQSDEWWEEATV